MNYSQSNTDTQNNSNSQQLPTIEVIHTKEGIKSITVFAADDKKPNSLIKTANDNKSSSLNTKNECNKTIKFFCDQCTFSTREENRLQAHRKSWHQEKKPSSTKNVILRCSQCGYVTQNAGNFKLHIETKHEKKKSFQCDKCEFATNYKDNLRQHVLNVHGEPHKCLQCSYTSPCVQKMLKHVEAIHENKETFKCLTLKTAPNLLKHVQLVHEAKKDETKKCLKCSFTSETAYTMRKHLENVHNKVKEEVITTNYTCMQCDFTTDSLDDLDLHVYNTHRVFTCHHCPYQTAYESVLHEHVKSVHKETKTTDLFELQLTTDDIKADHRFKCQKKTTDLFGPQLMTEDIKADHRFKCQQCDYSSNSAYSFANHSQRMHKTSEADKLKCPQCSYETGWPQNLEKHIQKIHEKNNPLIIKKKLKQCPYCDFSSALKENLNRHIKGIHERPMSEKDIKCDYCDYYSNFHNVVKHLKVIHADTPEGLEILNCDKCDFNTKHALLIRKHMEQVHDKKKGYKCSVCEFRADNWAKVKEHKMSSHPPNTDEKLKCPQCDHLAANTSNLNNHIKVVHDKRRDHKCGLCDFATFFRSGLRDHELRVHKLTTNTGLRTRKTQHVVLKCNKGEESSEKKLVKVEDVEEEEEEEEEDPLDVGHDESFPMEFDQIEIKTEVISTD